VFGTVAVFLSPTIANFIKEAGYDTVEKFTEFVPDRDLSGGTGFGGIVGGSFCVIVTGGSNNNYFSISGMRPGRKIAIDKWR
jgi:hypothetical protein